MSEHTPAPNPTRGVYGFAVFLLFKSLFIVYIFWAFVPQAFLEDTLGLTYLPNKYFALYIPILILTAATLFAFLIYPGMGVALTRDIDDMHTIRDKFTIYRCKHGDCDRKIENLDAEEKMCSYHLKNGTGAESNNGNEIWECDCVDREKCFLHRENFNYSNEIKLRKHVPTVSDLDIVDVCRKLYLNQ